MNRVEQMVVMTLIAAGGCGPSAGTAPVSTAAAASADGTVSETVSTAEIVRIDGQYLVERYPENGGSVVLRIEGDRAVVKPWSGEGEQVFALTGAFPGFRLVAESAGPASGTEGEGGMPRNISLLFTSKNGGRLWMSDEEPTFVHRLASLPEELRGKWEGINLATPETILGTLDFQEDRIEITPNESPLKIAYVYTETGDVGLVSVVETDEMRIMNGRFFAVEGGLVWQDRGNAAFLKRPGSAIPVNDGTPGREGKTQNFLTLDNGFFSYYPLRLDGDGGNFGRPGTEESGALTQPEFVGPAIRYTWAYRNFPIAVVTLEDRAWIWTAPSREPGTAALAETAGPTDALGEWQTAPIAGRPNPYARSVFNADGAVFYRHDGREVYCKWYADNTLFETDGGDSIEVHRAGNDLLVSGSSGWLAALYRGETPAYAQSVEKMGADLARVCRAAEGVSDGDLEARVAAATALAGTEAEISELLAHQLRVAAEMGGRGAFDAEMGYIGLTFPENCFR